MAGREPGPDRRLARAAGEALFIRVLRVRVSAMEGTSCRVAYAWE
jgi:hypothetical protein